MPGRRVYARFCHSSFTQASVAQTHELTRLVARTAFCKMQIVPAGVIFSRRIRSSSLELCFSAISHSCRNSATLTCSFIFFKSCSSSSMYRSLKKHSFSTSCRSCFARSLDGSSPHPFNLHTPVNLLCLNHGPHILLDVGLRAIEELMDVVLKPIDQAQGPDARGSA